MSTVSFTIENCDHSDYVFFPACAYQGNQFAVTKTAYPPMFTPQNAKVDMPVTITDVTCLNPDGSGKIEVTTGDVSVPCVGIFSRRNQKATFVFTVQQLAGENLGLAYEKGKITLSYPAQRDRLYRWPFMVEASELPPSETASNANPELVIPYQLIELPCQDLVQFYQVFFDNRKCMGLDDSLPEVLPFEEQWAIECAKYNASNYTDKKGYFLGRGIGWCGNAMGSTALMKRGGELEWQRGVRTLEFLFSVQQESGFFHGVINQDGSMPGDGWGKEGTQDWHLIRRSADVLYFLFKHFSLYQDKGLPVPKSFTQGASKLADAFVTLWKRYGQLGQFVNVHTGDMIVGGSTSGGIAGAGLVGAFRFFGNPEYLAVAKAIAESYYQRDAVQGYTTGGPGEILQCPDSESAFGLLESFVELYDETREAPWLAYAEFMLHQCSSWVVPYNYQFPQTSEFHRLGMKTVGSVFANVQNKHSAPGICTLSGNSIFKLYQFTGNEAYRQLIQEIALTVSQYMSTEARPIFTWDEPEKKVALPPGVMCERVNLSDWEHKRCVGGVFNGSCWCEVTNLLTLAELLLDEKTSSVLLERNK